MAIDWNKARTTAIWALSVASAALTVAAGVYLPTFIGYAGDIGELRGLTSTVNSRIDRLDGRFDSLDERLASIDATGQAIRADVGAIRTRMTEMEANPTEILRVAGMQINDWYFAAKVDDRMYVFPRSPEAAQQLIRWGLLETPITPYLKGFPIRVNDD